jgi:hypothetical protein
VASEQRAGAARASAKLVFKHDADLPISARREAIMEALRRRQVLIVAGETGSGKSTQLPQYCLELGRGMEAASRIPNRGGWRLAPWPRGLPKKSASLWAAASVFESDSPIRCPTPRAWC